MEQCVQAGLVSGRLVVTDSTHVKANASRASEHLVEVTGKPGAYWGRLDAYEEEGLEELERRIPERKTGKKRRQKKRTKPVKGDSRYTRKWISRTDPESGHLNRPGKPQGPHYLSHETVDCEHGIILETTVTLGAAYDLPLFHRVLREHNIWFYVRPNEPFSYDPEKDSYTCPNGKEPQLRNLTRSSGGLHWACFSNKTDCEACPRKTQCIGSRRAKVVERNYFWKEMKQDFSELDSPAYQKALRANGRFGARAPLPPKNGGTILLASYGED